MMILLTYDVSTESKAGAVRLRKVAKVCEDYGIRVQNSVFELIIDSAQLVLVKKRLEKIIDENTDSIRFYLLGNKWDNKIETMGVDTTLKMNDTLIL